MRVRHRQSENEPHRVSQRYCEAETACRDKSTQIDRESLSETDAQKKGTCFVTHECWYSGATEDVSAMWLAERHTASMHLVGMRHPMTA